MRVIAGTLGGRPLRAVPGRGTRPTADRVREALFSRLESRFPLAGRSVLDLFAGTGAVGIEAMSRGASELVSVENRPGAVRVIRANLESCGLSSRAEVLTCRAGAARERLRADARSFDGVFIDPPYGRELGADTLRKLSACELVRSGGFVAVETASGEDMPAGATGLTKLREDIYGDTKLVLYETEERGLA